MNVAGLKKQAARELASEVLQNVPCHILLPLFWISIFALWKCIGDSVLTTTKEPKGTEP